MALADRKATMFSYLAWQMEMRYCPAASNRSRLSGVLGMAAASHGCCADVSFESLRHCVACVGPLT